MRASDSVQAECTLALLSKLRLSKERIIGIVETYRLLKLLRPLLLRQVQDLLY